MSQTFSSHPLICAGIVDTIRGIKQGAINGMAARDIQEMIDTNKNSSSSASPPQDPPPGWGTDDLTKFFDTARYNQWATFWNKQGPTKKLIAIDAQFAKASKDWLNPQNEIAALMLLRCHAAFRTAGGLAMAGQATEAFVQCRAMLEYAAYAVHISRNPSLEVVWLDRHQNPASKKAQQNAFSHRSVLDSVRTANLRAAGNFETLYQRTIDFGGHPNDRAVTTNIKMTQESERRMMLTIMQHGDGVALDHVLKSTAQCGMASLEMLQIVFNARFELLGINASMTELRKGL
jgi:hypothetical protein